MLKAGTLQDFNGSMAAAIEEEFETLWRSRYGQDLPIETRNDRRLLFVAIAKGVITHLQERAEEAFDVTVTAEQIGSENWIESTGVTTDAGIHIHNVATQQSTTKQDGSENRVQSEGIGIVRILTE